MVREVLKSHFEFVVFDTVSSLIFSETRNEIFVHLGQNC